MKILWSILVDAPATAPSGSGFRTCLIFRWVANGEQDSARGPVRRAAVLSDSCAAGGAMRHGKAHLRNGSASGPPGTVAPPAPRPDRPREAVCRSEAEPGRRRRTGARSLIWACRGRGRRTLRADASGPVWAVRGAFGHNVKFCEVPVWISDAWLALNFVSHLAAPAAPGFELVGSQPSTNC